MSSASKRPSAAAYRDNDNVAAYVQQLAANHGVTFADNALDRLSADVSRLSDAEVNPDATADLLVALYRAGVISNRQNMELCHYRRPGRCLVRLIRALEQVSISP